MINTIVLVAHLIVCFLLTVVVLMQSSKGGGLSGAFGGSGQQIFGGHEAATFLGRATTYLAIIFMVTSLALAFLAAGGKGTGVQESALKRAAQRQQWGTVVPEEQKNVEEILGNVPPAGGAENQAGQEQGAPAGQTAPAGQGAASQSGAQETPKGPGGK